MKVDNLDLLLISPSLDWKSEKKQRETMRIEEDIPNQESLPLNIGYIIAVAKKNGLRVKFIDMVADGFDIETLVEFITKAKPSLVGFTAFTRQINAVGAISAQIKRNMSKATICVGGCHTSAIPVQTLDEFPEIDFVFCGEVEEQLPKILDCLGNSNALTQLPGVVTRNKNKNNPPRVLVSNLDEIPFPAWEEFDLHKYPGSNPHRTKLELPMIMTRGCPYRCTFCCRVNGDKIRYRSVHLVISEIERNIAEFGCEAIAFYDENFTIKKEWTDQLLSELISLGLNKKIKWSCSMRVNMATPELLKNMRKAGCYFVFFGFESASVPTLKRIKKGINVFQMRQAVRWTKEAGIIPVGAFMIGNPGDKDEDIYKSIQLGRELDLYSITFPIAVPYPGTEMREQALKNIYGMRILSNNWDLYGRKAADSKEDFEIMESDELTSRRRIELQEIAYSQHPKKSLSDYSVS